MRMNAISPSFLVSTIATVHSPLLALARTDPAWRRARTEVTLPVRSIPGSRTKHTRRSAHAARIDDGPAVAGFECDRLRRRGVPERGDRFADRGRRPPPLRLCPGASAYRPARQRTAGAWRQGGRPRRHAGLERLSPL